MKSLGLMYVGMRMCACFEHVHSYVTITTVTSFSWIKHKCNYKNYLFACTAQLWKRIRQSAFSYVGGEGSCIRRLRLVTYFLKFY